MSYGSLSREIKLALAKGSASVKSAMCSGEGGILKESLENAYKYIFEYVLNRYSVTDENLKIFTISIISPIQSFSSSSYGKFPLNISFDKSENSVNTFIQIKRYPIRNLTYRISNDSFNDLLSNFKF